MLPSIDKQRIKSDLLLSLLRSQHGPTALVWSWCTIMFAIIYLCSLYCTSVLLNFSWIRREAQDFTTSYYYQICTQANPKVIRIARQQPVKMFLTINSTFLSTNLSSLGEAMKYIYHSYGGFKRVWEMYTCTCPLHAPPSFPSPTHFIKPPLWYLTESLPLWVKYKCFVYRLFIFAFDRKDNGLCVILLSLRGLSSRKGLHS